MTFGNIFVRWGSLAALMFFYPTLAMSNKDCARSSQPPHRLPPFAEALLDRLTQGSRGWTQEALWALVNGGSTRTASTQNRISFAQDSTHTFRVLTEGLLVKEAVSPIGKPRILRVLVPGDFLSPLDEISETPASWRALTPVQILEIPWAPQEAASVELALAVQTLWHHQSDVAQRMAEHSGLSPSERLIQSLVRLLHRHTDLNPSMAETNPLLPLSRQDVVAWMGWPGVATIQKISREVVDHVQWLGQEVRVSDPGNLNGRWNPSAIEPSPPQDMSTLEAVDHQVMAERLQAWLEHHPTLAELITTSDVRSFASLFSREFVVGPHQTLMAPEGPTLVFLVSGLLAHKPHPPGDASEQFWLPGKVTLLKEGLPIPRALTESLVWTAPLNSSFLGNLSQEVLRVLYVSSLIESRFMEAWTLRAPSHKVHPWLARFFVELMERQNLAGSVDRSEPLRFPFSRAEFASFLHVRDRDLAAAIHNLMFQNVLASPERSDRSFQIHITNPTQLALWAAPQLPEDSRN